MGFVFVAWGYLNPLDLTTILFKDCWGQMSELGTSLVGSEVVPARSVKTTHGIFLCPFQPELTPCSGLLPASLWLASRWTAEGWCIATTTSRHKDTWSSKFHVLSWFHVLSSHVCFEWSTRHEYPVYICLHIILIHQNLFVVLPKPLFTIPFSIPFSSFSWSSFSLKDEGCNVP